MSESMWQILVKTALLGTERAELPEEILDFLTKNNLSTQSSVEENLLRYIASITAFRKANINLKPIKWAKYDALSSTKSCSKVVADSLNLMLNGMYSEAVPELLDLLKDKKLTLPTSILPALFEKSIKNHAFWQMIQPVLGEDGFWLLHQNKNWQSLWSKSVDKNWQTATSTERLSILTQIRNSQNPTNATDLLLQTWPFEDWRTKVDFLKILALGLSPNDETILNEAIKDSRKEVRITAAGLLFQLPESAFTKSCFEWVKPFFNLKSGQLIVNLPDLDENPFAEFVDLSKKKPKKNSLKLITLMEIFAKIPLQKWSLHFGLNSEQLVVLFFRSNLAEELSDAMLEAVLNQQNEEWALPILTHWLFKRNNINWTNWSPSKLTDLLSSESFNTLALQVYDKEKPILDKHEPLFIFLKNSTQKWSEKLASAILLSFANSLNEIKEMDWTLWHYSELLPQAAYRVPPTMKDIFKTAWNHQEPSVQMWEPVIEKFLQTLSFRNHLIKEIS